MLIRIYLLLFLAPLPAGLKAQSALISLPSMNVVYLGISNPIEVAAYKYPCKRLMVLTDNGTIERADGCTFYYAPVRFGVAELRVVAINRGDTILLRQITVRVKDIPDPVARVGGMHSGTMSRHLLSAQDGVIAALEGFGFDAKFLVRGFTATVLRAQGGCASASSSTGPRFTPEMYALFDTLVPGDVVLISSIRCTGPDGVARDLAAIQLLIL